MMIRRALPTPVGVCVVVALSACAPTVHLEPAPDATNVACADIMVHLPERVADQPRRATDAQASAAWGNPAAVLARCGVPIPGPSTLPCVSINGIDWIENESARPLIRYVTYGRNPATEIAVDSALVSGATALVDLAAAVDRATPRSRCTSVSESETR